MANNIAQGLLTIGAGLTQAAAIPELQKRAQQREVEAKLNEQKLEANKIALRSATQELHSKKIKEIGASYVNLDSGARGDFLSSREDDINKYAQSLGVSASDIKVMIKDQGTRFEKRKSLASSNLESMALSLESWAPDEAKRVRSLTDGFGNIKSEDELDSRIKEIQSEANKIFTQANQVRVAKIREKKFEFSKEEKIANEQEKAITRLQDKFNSDSAVKSAVKAGGDAARILKLADLDNPIAQASIPTFMARAAGEVGNLSEADKAPFGGTTALQGRIGQVFQRAKEGTLTEENKAFVMELAETMRIHSQKVQAQRARFFASQGVRGSRFLKDENSVFKALAPGFSDDESTDIPEAPSKQGIPRGDDLKKQQRDTLNQINTALQSPGIPDAKKKQLQEVKKQLEDLLR